MSDNLFLHEEAVVVWIKGREAVLDAESFVASAELHLRGLFPEISKEVEKFLANSASGKSHESPEGKRISSDI
ncbi:MAG: hypothetical protein JXA15_09475 [Spirochaetales bacterium]|nr:hypothetical protein [Spirochaetales bacterium]